MLHKDHEELTSDSNMRILFGHGREFLPRSGTARSPHPNDIRTARVFVDQYQRDYAFADPTDYEMDSETYTHVPAIPFTDRLFFAVPSNLVTQYRRDEDSVDAETLRFPQEEDTILLRPADRPNQPGITCVVKRLVEPNSSHGQRVASGLIEIDGHISTSRVAAVGGGDVMSAQAKVETAIRMLSSFQ